MNVAVDNQTMDENDNQGDLTQDTTSDLTQQTSDVVDQGETQEQTTQNAYQPFSAGKEKFKVNGKEEEWDWETTRKYASLGKTSYQKMQEAAKIKKDAESAYSQLLDLARRDPDTLIRALNPNYNPQSSANTRQDQVTEDVDPRDARIQELERKIGDLSGGLEKQQIEEERKIINQELSDAETKYPVIKGDKFAINYIKSEYRKALMSGLEEITIDDVAFHVAQELQSQKTQRVQDTQKRIEQKRKNAPVNVVSAGHDTSKKGMTLDEVKRLAGRS